MIKLEALQEHRAADVAGGRDGCDTHTEVSVLSSQVVCDVVNAF